jgi:hypothetical protein
MQMGGRLAARGQDEVSERRQLRIQLVYPNLEMRRGMDERVLIACTSVDRMRIEDTRLKV